MQKCPRFQSSNWFETPDGELAYIKFSNKMNAQNNRPAPSVNEHSLIAIREENGNQLVDARELHQFLESKQNFTNWIQNRIRDYGFVENEDFEVFNNFIKNPQGGRPSKDYAISIDMAKELSMVERNQKGRQARRYFIEAEKQLRNAVPKLALQVELPEVSSININDVDYFNYWQFINGLLGYAGGSQYDRTTKYPDRFIKVNGIWYIEKSYAIEIAVNRQLGLIKRKRVVLVPISQLKLGL